MSITNHRIKKTQLGQFFTKSDPFNNWVFKYWFENALKNSKSKIVLEPFVGNGDIIRILKKNYDFDFVGYDIDPKNTSTKKQNTLKKYPKNFDIAITNPPYLARNSATRKKITWIYDGFDDLYKVSLNKMLENNNYVAAIVPATLITSGLFKDRLSNYILLNMNMFLDTNTPVCLALFEPNKSADFKIWELNDTTDICFVGSFYEVKNTLNQILKKKRSLKIKFNHQDGQVGVFATDKSYSSIKFVKGIYIPDSKVKNSSRNLVRIKINQKISIRNLNNKLKDFLLNNGDIFLAPFKSLRKDKKYRRRLDFNTIRRIIESC